jgi:hypothetical protein
VAWIVPLILLGGALIIVLRRRPKVVEQDSKDFREALGVWLPLVAARQNTPREVKRYVNRVRLLAMRQRAEEDSGRTQLDEHTLVALGALHHVDESLLDPPPSLGGGPAAGARIMAAGHSWGEHIKEPLDEAMQRHTRSGAPWPPAPDVVRRFHGLMGGVQVNR